MEQNDLIAEISWLRTKVADEVSNVSNDPRAKAMVLTKLDEAQLWATRLVKGEED